MPAFYLKCPKCLVESRKILPVYKETKCKTCGTVCERANKSKQSSVIKEVLDNGIMPRKVERIHNINELRKEKSQPEKPTDLV
jgi:hypothetical protein